MVSSSTAQQHDNTQRDAGAVAARRLRNSAVSLVPGPKPLTKYKFYLDVKNHITSGKLEAKIKDLGGVLELFLVREVTHVVTDREEWSSGARGVGAHPRTPRTPRLQDASAGDGHHQQQQDYVANRTPARGRPKTRADAMLERARSNTPKQTHAAQLRDDTFKQAKAWGIPVWTVERVFAWLDKIALSVEAEKQKPRRKCKLVELKAPYVKFESFDRRHRPVFKEIRNWPTFNLAGAAGSAAVQHKPPGTAVAPPSGEQRMMTKSRAPPSRNKVRSAPVQSGYCELCREEYQILGEHLESKKHQAFIKDNDNFLELDSLIQDGTDLTSFLKFADTKCNGVVERPNHCTRHSHKMPRRRTSSINDCIVNKVKNANPVSPTGSEAGHRLRTRKTNMTYIALTAQEQEEDVVKPECAREVRELRSAHRLQKLAESDTWSSGRPKRTCLRQKRHSFLEETGLPVETRGFYKVEMTPKLRSSAVSATYKEYKDDVKKSPVAERVEPPAEETPQPEYVDNKSLLIKFRRMRSSELRQLNDEAVNFLFPKKEESSSEEDIDGDGRDTTVSTHPGDSILISSETDTENECCEVVEEHEGDCCDRTGTAECKRKKRTQVEAFIEDNKKYYKFETPGSRLRYHGTTLPAPTLATPRKVSRLNGDTCNESSKSELELTADQPSTNECDTEERPKDDIKFTLDELQFSFERIPKSEPWYEVFSRQDQGAEYYTCFSDSGYWKPLLLPYQMDRIQPLDPKICIQTYTQIKKLLADGSSGSNSTPSYSTPDCSAQGSPAPEVDENSKTSEDIPLDQHRLLLKQQQQRRKRKKGILLPSKNPRKSPRQHASTLAILSSLIQHRKKRKSSSPNNTLDSIPEASESQDEGAPKTQPTHPEDDINKMAASIDDMLSNAFGDLEQVEMTMHEDVQRLDFSCRSDALEILEEYENHKHNERKTGLIGHSRRSYSPGKKPGRKKKKNRTGWPKNSIRRTNLGAVLNKTADEERVAEQQDDNANVDTDDDAAVSADSTVNELSMCVDVSVNSKSISSAEVDDRVSSHDVDTSVSSVDLDKWENAEKVLSTKVTNDVNKEPPLEDVSDDAPLDKMDIADDDGDDGGGGRQGKRRLRSSSTPPRSYSKGAKRSRRMPASPKSPRVLRKPRGRWYRER